MQPMKKILSSPYTWLIVAGIGIIVAGVFIRRNPASQEIGKPVPEKVSVPKKVPEKFGIPLPGYEIKKKTVKKNTFFSDLMLAEGVPYLRMDSLLKIGDSVFDVRHVQTGKNFYFFHRKDSTHKVDYVVYEPDAINYIVFGMRDSLFVQHRRKAVTHRKKYASGEITSSLWNSLAAQHLNPYLAVHLSEIFAWSVDFFGIQKGDNYQVLYEETYVNDSSIGIHKVLAARFENAGHAYYAFYFARDSIADYFDENGGSMRRTFLKAPLKYSRISSRFSNHRYHPVLKIYRPHHGVDYAAPTGTPIHAVGDGRIVKRGWSGGGGRAIKIKHNGTYTTQYMHMSRYGKFKKGDYVHQGDVIGYVGSSGLATGPHLDFRFYINGKPVDPLKVKSPPAKPLPAAYMDTFKIYVDKTMETLLRLKEKPIDAHQDSEDTTAQPEIHQ